MFTHLTLASLPVRDQERSRAFFVDKLGFEVRTDAAYGDARWVEIAPPGARTGVVLSQVDDDAAYGQTMSGILLGCDDLDAAVKLLRERDVEVTDPDTQHWGRFILVTEPDGRKICVTQNGSTMRDAG